MKILDQKFKDNKARYVLQCTLATLSVLIVLLILDTISDAAIIAALGASSFIAFTMPDARVSKPRFMIGGYLVGIAAGGLSYTLSLLPPLIQSPAVPEIPCIAFGALAVGLAIFVMVITDTEHPPAAGVALGLVLDGFSHMAAVVALIGIISLSVIKAVLGPVLKDLL